MLLPWSSHQDKSWALFYWVTPLPNGWAARQGSWRCFLWKPPTKTSLRGADGRWSGPKSLSPARVGVGHSGRGNGRSGSPSDQPQLPTSAAGGTVSRPQTLCLCPGGARLVSAHLDLLCEREGTPHAGPGGRSESLHGLTQACLRTAPGQGGPRLREGQPLAWGHTARPAPLHVTIIPSSGLTTGQAKPRYRAVGGGGGRNITKFSSKWSQPSTG